MTNICVTTGIGVVLPNTRSLEKLWNDCLGRDESSARSDGKGAQGFVSEELFEGCIPPRLSKKLDAFTRYALAATHFAIEDAKLALSEADKERCGVFVGNCFGGWRFTEPELRNLHCDGPRSVSPFQATSWFPAAPQGQISIHYGLKGYSKTFMADRASSLLSISAAAQQIKQGNLDIAIAGGTESTNTDFVKAALRRLKKDRDGDDDAFSPFAPGRDGFAVSEGAVFIVMESERHARARGAKIYGRVEDFVIRNSPCDTDEYGADPIPFIQSMKGVCNGAAPDLTLPDACGFSDCDRAEAHAISEVFDDVKITYPKARLKHLFGAEGALDVALSCLMLERQQILPTFVDEIGPPLKPTQVARELIDARLDRILINARASGGAVGSLVVSRMEA
jgi:3-oxoacyl-(acyl-carrier-protein) synthase